MHSSVCNLCFHIWLYTWRRFCSFSTSIYSFSFSFSSIIADFSFSAIAVAQSVGGVCSVPFVFGTFYTQNFRIQGPLFSVWIHLNCSLPLKFVFFWSVPPLKEFFSAFHITFRTWVLHSSKAKQAVCLFCSRVFHRSTNVAYYRIFTFTSPPYKGLSIAYIWKVNEVRA